MPKKCAPGVFCIENMTLAILCIVFFILAYIVYLISNRHTPIIIFPNKIDHSEKIPDIHHKSRPNVILDPYGPPLRSDDMYFPKDSGDIRGLPFIPRHGIETRGLSMDYSQLGILTRDNGSEMILPLMGRRLTRSDKWQYYTISNTGNVNTKLPISYKGKSCSGEYGCDEIMNGDTVYVEGYKDIFHATIYENGRFSYNPIF
jgi:hypothetical protein